MSAAPVHDRAALEKRLGHRFANPSILDRALTHRTFREEQNGDVLDNQRLEFLGDAILGLVVAEELWTGLEDLDEGWLSEIRASLVSEEALHLRAADLGLDAHLRVGRGAARKGDAQRPSTMSDSYEAVLAAVYLDGGLDAARAAVRGWLPAAVAEARAKPREELRSATRHPKNHLQERLQRRGQGTPVYAVTAQEGPAHKAVWSVEVRRGDGSVIGRGTGGTKQLAETRAAEEALATLPPEAR